MFLFICYVCSLFAILNSTSFQLTIFQILCNDYRVIQLLCLENVQKKVMGCTYMRQ